MINVSNEFIAVMNENRKFRQVAEITLLDGTVLNLTEHDFTPHNNYVSDGSGASGIPLGVAIGRSIQIEIINEEEKYSSYDFYGAEIVLYLTYKLSETTERIEMGTFTVTSPATYGDTIIMNALDHMHKADKSYATSLAFPATAQSVLVDACSSCDIPLLSTSFLNDDFVIDSIPSSQYTFREVIGFVAMIAAGNARINRQGYLEIITYDFSYLGLILDGGTFEPWTEGNAIDGGTFEFLETEEIDGGDYGKRKYHVFADFKNLKVDTDSVTITGLKTTTQGDTATVLLEGEEGYVLELKNPLFEGKEASVLALIGPVLIGGQMRKFEADAICYPLAEFMDPCIVVDRKGNAYPTVLTDVNFVFFGFTTLRNSAESSSTLGNKYPSNYVNAVIEANKLVQKEKTDRELALEQLNKKLSNSSGLYVTTETQEDGSTIYYMHDKPTLDESEIVWKYTSQAFGVSIDGGKTYPYGFSATGEAIANLLYANGINANYITSGTIKAQNIELEGLITTNGNFKILSDGSIEAVNATLNGSLISYSDNSTCYMHNGEMRLYPEKVADPSSYEGDDYSFLSHDKFVLNGSAYINDLKAGPIGHKVMLSELTNGFYGLVDSSGSNSNWIRTTSNGLIPYQSGGSGSIGTSGWEFNNGHFKNIHTGAINFGSYGAGVLWDTTFGQAGLYSLSNGGGLYLMTISSEVTGGWYSNVLLADSSGVNLVPKTGGIFTGAVAVNGILTTNARLDANANIRMAHGIGLYGNTDAGNPYWIVGVEKRSSGNTADGEVNCIRLGHTSLRTYVYTSDTGKKVYSNGEWYNFSDERLKKDFVALDERYLEAFDNFEPVYFTWIEGESKQIGYKAQQILKAMTDAGIPEEENTVVDLSPEYVDFEAHCKGVNEYYALGYESIDVIANYALQDARKRLKSLEEAVVTLEKKINDAGIA